MKINKKFAFLLVVEVCLFIILLITANIYNRFYSSGKSFPGTKVVSINPGTSVTKAAKILADSSVIKSRKDFLSFARIFRRGDDIKYGIYNFDNTVSVARAFDILNAGASQLKKVTLPEGIGLKGIASILARRLDKDSTRIMNLANNPDFCIALKVPASSLEGFLLPETYFFDPLADESSILKVMAQNSIDILNENKTALIKSGWTGLQIITMASLVEGECQIDSERPVVASVYFNRLKRNMALQADPTIQYILKGKPRRLRNRDLKIDSQYNTYKYKGLPPGPINNPGKKSILAAIYPDTTKFLYFVARGDGGHYFSPTFAEHLQNKKKFDRIRRKVFYEKRKKRGH